MTIHKDVAYKLMFWVSMTFQTQVLNWSTIFK